MRDSRQRVVKPRQCKLATEIMDRYLFSYRRYLREKERQETIAGVKRGIADMKAGRVKDAEQVFREIEERFGIPSDL